MLLSLILGWIALVLTVLTVLKWAARTSGNKGLNRFFHRVHIPFGILLLVVGLIHGILAGNFPGASLWDMELAPVLFTLNWGTACIVCAFLLGLSYLLRRKIHGKWMLCHRILTVVLLLCLGLHLFDVGIQLPGRLLGSEGNGADTLAAEASESAGLSAFGEPNPTLSMAPTATPSSTGAEDGTGTRTRTRIRNRAGVGTDEDIMSTNEGAEPEAAPPETTLETTPEPTPEPTPVVTFSGAALADGTYQGSAEGYHGQIVLSVTVSGGQVTDITVESNNDTPRFFDYAVGVVDTILEEQSLEVDAVTGATFSSAGIMNAVYNALQEAVVSGELKITQIDLSGVRRH